MRQLARTFNYVAGIDRCASGPYNRLDGCMRSEPSCSEADKVSAVARTAFMCHLQKKDIALFETKVRTLGGTWRGVQIIRNPITMLLSAYVYHMQGLDCDGCDCKRMKTLSVQDGLALQAKCTLTDVEKMVTSYNASRTKTNMLALRLEDFTSSSTSYDLQVQRLCHHFSSTCVDRLGLFVNLSSSFDLRRVPRPVGSELGGAKHVSSKEALLKASAAYKSLPEDQVKIFGMHAAALGYPSMPL